MNILHLTVLGTVFLWETNTIRCGDVAVVVISLAASALPTDQIDTAVEVVRRVMFMSGMIVITDAVVLVPQGLAVMLGKKKIERDGRRVDPDQKIVRIAGLPAQTVIGRADVGSLIEVAVTSICLPNKGRTIVTRVVVMLDVGDHRRALIVESENEVGRILGRDRGHGIVPQTVEVEVTAEAEAPALIENPGSIFKPLEEGDYDSVHFLTWHWFFHFS